jgi:hypothetical protein
MKSKYAFYRGKGIIRILILFLIFSSTELGAQWIDDPTKDQIPWEVAKNLNPQMFDATVVTVGGYDNFFLGTDFAEGHISENPRMPGQYFVAFNINGTWYSLNGYDWLQNNPVFTSTMRGDPVAAHDSLGNLYYENMYGSPSILGTKIIKSTNNSVTWLPDVFGNTGVDKNWIAADQTGGPFANFVYTVMTASSGGNFKRSTNGGASFDLTFSPGTQSLPGMMVCVGANGSVSGGAVYVVTNSGSSFASTYTFYRSTNGGANFTLMSSQNFANYVGTNVGGRNSVANMRTRPYPFITADNSFGPNRGRLYVVYASNEPAGNGNKSDIFSRYSTNGGSTWSSPVKVNDDLNTQNHQQWHPATWCDKETGRLYVQWMDTRDTPTSDSAYMYATYSTDGGLTFVPNQRISNAKMKIDCPTCGGGGTPRYQGDYNGIVSNGKTSMLVWTDFRAGRFDSYVSYFPDFAFTVTPALDSINAVNGMIDFIMAKPSSKLHTDTVYFSTTVTPNPGAGLTISYPSGNFLPLTTGSRRVRFTANNLTPGTYTVTVTAKGPNGTPVHKRNVTIVASSTVTGVTNETNIPTKFDLLQNFPNPFNPTTKITYTLAKNTSVKLTVYNGAGERVKSYNIGTQNAGIYNVDFDGKGLASGVYYYKLETEFFTATRKMLLIK